MIGSGEMTSEDRPEWLPSAWTVQVTDTNGRKVVCYQNPEGREFYSEADVFQYLETIKHNTTSEKNDEKSSSEPRTSENSKPTSVRRSMSRKKKSGIRKSNYCKVYSRTPADGLPPGWIKEVRIRKISRSKDPYYIDPVSGYIFFSKLDALRYLDTGDIKSCVMKPMKKDSNGIETTNYEIDGQESTSSTTRRQLFEEPENTAETQDGENTAIDASIPTTITPPGDKKTPENDTARHSHRTNKSKNPSATLSGRSSKRPQAPETKSSPPEKEKNDGNVTNDPVGSQVGLENENPTKVD